METDVLRHARGFVGQKTNDSDENVEIRQRDANLQTDWLGNQSKVETD
jgi:hypothetical protein